MVIYVKYLFLCYLTILPLLMITLWYLWGVGLIVMILNEFLCNLCEIIAFDGLKGLLVHFDNIFRFVRRMEK